jgi:hypothetical protein
MPNVRRTESVTTKKSLVFELSEFETDPPGSTTFVTLDVLGETGGFIGPNKSLQRAALRAAAERYR